MADDADYLANYRTDELYINPGSAGAYATIVSEGDEISLGEIEITSRCKLSVSAFYVSEKEDYNSFKIIKLKWSKRKGWYEDSHIKLNHFFVARMVEIIALFSHLNLHDAKKARLSLDNVSVGDLGVC